MTVKVLTGAALAALASLAAPASAASFIGDNVTIQRVQGGQPVFSPVSDIVGDGFEYTDNFFAIDITANEVVFKAFGGNFSLGDIAYDISGLDFDDKPGTPNLVTGFASSQIFNANMTAIGASRATILPSGIFRMSFKDTLGGSSGFARITFGAAPPTGAVPEPSTWAMLLVGFGLVGGSIRASRRQKGFALGAA